MNKFYKQEDEEKLVALHTPLVVSIAFSYNPRPPYDYEDLISIGMIGLLKAIRSYDPARGTQFSTVASIIIRREIIRELQKNNNSKFHEQIDENIVEESRLNNLIIDEYLPDDLEEEDRKILYDRFYLNKTFEDIGSSFGFTKQWAHMKMSGILNKIRDSNAAKKAKNSIS